MKYRQSFLGIMHLELTGADIPGTLNALAQAGIRIFDTESIDFLTIHLVIYRTDYKKVKNLTLKRGGNVKLLASSGLAWNIKGLLRRPLLTFGVLMIAFLSMWVPSRIFFIRVEGNTTLEARQIIAQAQQCGISFGVSRREVRSEKMKNNLLASMPELQWAGVNTYGCVAVITVLERSEQQDEVETREVCSIVAAQDGIITEMTVVRGNALCQPGQAVKKGQVLISGYTDCGICIQATRAEGEVYAQTMRELSVVSPSVFEVRGEIRKTDRKISIIFGKKRINFNNSSGISDAGCAKIYEWNYISFPGGFILPICVVTETVIYLETQIASWEGCHEVISGFSQDYVRRLMNAGTIIQVSETITELEGAVRQDGIYCCCEMIGVTRIEENLNAYAQND